MRSLKTHKRRFRDHLFLCPECGTTSAFPLRWTVLLFPVRWTVEWIREGNNFRQRERREEERKRNLFFSLLLFFLSLSPSLPHFLPRPRVSLSLLRRKFPSRGEISFSLFFSSFSHSLLLFLTFFLARASLSLSCDGNFRREEKFLFLSSSLLSLTLSFSSSLSSSPARLSLSLPLATEISVARRDFFFSLLSLFRHPLCSPAHDIFITKRLRGCGVTCRFRTWA